MFNDRHLLRQLAALLAFILVGGSVSYTIVEPGWTLFDGFYMTLITLTTIGFSEVHALSTGGRMLTVGVIVFGLGAAATIISQLAQLMMEGNILTVWKERRMEKRIAKMKNHVIICGYGRIGQAISRDLTNMGVPCVIIDREESRVDSAQKLQVPVLSGNATADLALLNAGIERAAILVAALSNDSDNLFVALAARDLNSNLVVIARGEDKSIETRMLRAGVDRVVYPAQLGGGQIARIIGSELGHGEDENSGHRHSDVMGYELQVYRNFNKTGTNVGQILAKTGALRAVAHIDGNGARHQEPDRGHEISEGEVVVLLTELMATTTVSTPDDDVGLPPDLSVGIPAIDEEHQRIISMIKHLQTMDLDHNSQKAHEVLADLREDMVRHFKHEEALFRSADYPEAHEHIAEHRALTQRVDLLLAEDAHLHPDNMMHLLDVWVRDHIMYVDQRYAKFLTRQEAEAETVDSTGR